MKPHQQTIRRTCRQMAAILTIAVGANAAAGESDRFANVTISAVHVAGSVHMLMGAGGNIGASVGPDGTLIIDDQFAPLADRIQTALKDLGGDRPRLVLNTHYHGDHTGSNAYFGTTGTIIAHDNVRIRLLAEDGLDRSAMPLVTYDDHATVHFNDEEIQLIHLPAGHTDGDSVVWFRTANVIHMGDLLFNGRFPFIDTSSGGSVAGFVANLQAVLERVPADIRVIPGHGELTDRGAIEEAVAMIGATRRIVADALAAGQSREAILAAGLGERWTAFGAGFVNEQRWIETLLADLTAAR